MKDKCKPPSSKAIQAECENLEHELAEINGQINLCKAIEQCRTESEQKLYEAVSKYVGYAVTAKNYDDLKLSRAECDALLDEICDQPDALIRPSHSVLQYSLIRKHPEIEAALPVKTDKTDNSTAGLGAIKEFHNKYYTSRAQEIIQEYHSENTAKAHKSDLAYWQAWLSAIDFSFNNPISQAEIKRFIIDHVDGTIEPMADRRLVEQGYKSKLGPHSLATVKRRVFSLSRFLTLVEWPNPCKHEKIKELLVKLTKTYGTSKPAGKAITKDILFDMLDTCKKNRKKDIRDKALLLFGWGSGGRRRSEITAAQMKDLTKTPNDEYVYTIPKSKTDQTGEGHPVPVKGCVAKALNKWLDTAKITDGHIFRSVKKGGIIGEKLADIEVYRIVKRRLKKAGYDEKQYVAHSLRSGFVTTAGQRNKPLGDVMQMTTHRSIATVMRYYQAGNISNNSAANLADKE